MERRLSSYTDSASIIEYGEYKPGLAQLPAPNKVDVARKHFHESSAQNRLVVTRHPNFKNAFFLNLTQPRLDSRVLQRRCMRHESQKLEWENVFEPSIHEVESLLLPIVCCDVEYRFLPRRQIGNRR